MAGMFEKLNLKGQTEILVVNAPESFEPELAALSGVAVKRKASQVKQIAFCLVFVTQQQEIDLLAPVMAKKAVGDAVVWFAYPKGTSKKYRCDFNRDQGWERLEAAGFRGVRMVAIDADWSALRFRRVEFIKSLQK